MDVVHPLDPAVLTSSHPGWHMLSADLLALDGRVDPSARRRGVALRLVAAGLTPDLLESLLPGWVRYLEGPRPAGGDRVA